MSHREREREREGERERDDSISKPQIMPDLQ